jgi:hypothetical protein
VLVTLTNVFRFQKLSFFRALIFEQRRSGIIQIIEQIAHTGSAPLSHNILDNQYAKVDKTFLVGGNSLSAGKTCFIVDPDELLMSLCILKNFARLV